MPTIPQTKNLKANTSQIMNVIWKNASPYYRSLVQEVTDGDVSSLRAVGTTLLNNDGLMNEFLTALLNRIGMVWVSSKLYTNPWAFMKKGLMELGEVVEDIFVGLAMPHLYDPQNAESKVFEREIPDVQSVFHVVNYRTFYKQTIQNDSLRNAFLTWDGITDLIARIVEQMYSSASYDEFLVTKYMLAMALSNGQIATSAVGTVSTANMKSIVSSMKAQSNLMTFMSTQYNLAGVETYTDKADQYIIINSRFDADMAVEVLATSFNMDKAALMGRVVLVDDFGTFNMNRLNILLKGMPNFNSITSAQLTALKNVPAILVDKDWFMIFDQLLKMTDIYNNEGLYWNYTLHVWKIFSYSPFKNAVAFLQTAPTVTAVTINPATATAKAGSELSFTATVTGSDFISQAVVWSAVNGTEQVNIGSDGKLKISSNAAGTITVTARSVADNTKSGTATVTISS